MYWNLNTPKGPTRRDFSCMRMRMAVSIAAVLCFAASGQAGGQEKGNGNSHKIVAISINRGTFVDCSADCPAMKRLTAGKILMGATDAQRKRFALQPLEGPDIASPREVQLGHDFAIGIFDVTRKEFASFV